MHKYNLVPTIYSVLVKCTHSNISQLRISWSGRNTFQVGLSSNRRYTIKSMTHFYVSPLQNKKN